MKLTLSQIFTINKSAYELVAKEYDESFKTRLSFNRKVVRSYVKDLKSVSRTDNPRVLDIGCSVGVDSFCLSTEGCLVTGIDVSPIMVSLARKNVPGANFVAGNFWDYQFNETFDGVYAQNFIHLFPMKVAQKMIMKMAGLLNDNGLIHLTTSEEGLSREGLFEKKGYQKKTLRYRKFWEENELREFIQGMGLKIHRFYKLSPLVGFPWMVVEVTK